MNYARRFAYMSLGALLVLSLIMGMVAFAQDDAEGETPVTQDGVPVPAEGIQAAGDTRRGPEPGRHGPPLPQRNDAELLAEALDISVEELESARDAAYTAAIDQALAEGLITEAQAEALQERGLGNRAQPILGRWLDVDKDALLAEALGISVEALETARAEVRAAHLAAMVEAGAITQEQADMIAAREAVQNYVDREALSETVRNTYETAVAEALAAGEITQAQADQLLENLSTYEFRFGGPGRSGPGHHGGGRPGPGRSSAPNGMEGPAPQGPAGA